jgi:hypothetical protein
MPDIRISRDAIVLDEDGDPISPTQTGQALAIATAVVNGQKAKAMILIKSDLARDCDDETLARIAAPELHRSLAALRAGAQATD